MTAVVDSQRDNGLVRSLLRPEAYPDRTAHVELRETHISWVFLTDHYAYKLKKPVQYDFLDFSTVDRRRDACQHEVRLNDHWAPGVYVGLEPVCRSADGSIFVGQANGRAEVIDWVVKMHRLPDSLRVDQLIRDRALTDRDRQRVVAHLVRQYLDLPPLTMRASEYRDRVAAHVRGNWAVLRTASELPAVEVERCHREQVRWMRLMRSELEDRARNGRIVDGHGDLRPDHIYLTDPPVVIDCIEFNDDLRRVDTLDDLAFLAMDCEVLGETELGRMLLREYRRASQDEFPDELFSFYVSYRAAVRAKVHWLQALQAAADRHNALVAKATDYIRLADRAASRLLPPLVIIMRGVSGSGKSTLAERLTDELALTRLATDRLRQSMYGREAEPVPWQQGRYSAAARKEVYRALLRAASQQLSQRLSVLLDGTFLDEADCRAAMDLARQYGALPLLVECRCPVAVIRSRLAARLTQSDTESEANWDIAQHQLEQYVPLQCAPVVQVDTTASLPEQVDQVATRLSRQLETTRAADRASPVD